MTISVRARALTAGAALVAIIALSGCSALNGLFGEPVTRDADTQEVTEAGTADVFSLRVGDCFDDEAFEAEIEDVAAVPCTEPHDNEIFHSFEMPAGEWPGDEAIDTASLEQCTAAFATFVGIAYESSALDWSTITPLQDGWETIDDREVLCIAWDPAGKLQGSIAGIAR